MTLEYRCSNCGMLLQTTNADPLHDEIERLRAGRLTLPEIDEALIAFGVATTQTEVDPDRRWEAIKAVSEFLGRIRLAHTRG